MKTNEVMITHLTEQKAEDTKNLILLGLSDYFSEIDHHLNPDVDKLVETFSVKGNCFLIGTINDGVIASGGLIKEQVSVGRIVRMSVHRDYRNRGIAAKMLGHLEDEARNLGYDKIVLETTEDWEKAIQFYKKNGYLEDYIINGEIHFYKILRTHKKDT